MFSRSFQKIQNDILAICFFFLSLFFTFSFYSYNPSDPSLNSIGSALRPKNWCGYFGSFSADFFYQFFGMSSWVLVFAFILMSFKTLKKGGFEKKWEKQVWLIFLLISLSSLLEMHFEQFKFYGQRVGMGGFIGAFLASSLLKGLNLYGTTLFLVCFSLIALIFITDWTFRGMSEKLFLILFSLNRVLLGVHRGFVKIFCFVFSKLEKIGLGVLRVKEQVPKISKLGMSPVSLFSNKQEVFEESEETSGERRSGTVQSLSLIRKIFFIFRDKKQTGFSVSESSESFKDEELGESQTEEEIEEKTYRQVRLKTQVQRKVANWRLPDIKMLKDPPTSRYRIGSSEIQRKSEILIDKLSQFSVDGEITGVKSGPAVTLFEFKPSAHVKISKITELADDLSLALSSESVRIIAPIPGRDVVGIETSNSNRETVFLKDIIAHEDFWMDETRLPLSLGRQANGQIKVVDLRRMPHLLVAGTTGSGKSVFVVCALAGLLFRHSPKTLRLILIDPKQVDLSTFNDVPHLLMPTLCEAKKAVAALKWAVREMEKRYRSMSKFGSRGLEAFNEKVLKLTKGEISQHTAYNEELEQTRRSHETYYFVPQPYIVVVVEEFGDLMTVDKNNVEQLVVRLAQMARASGIHLILAMQSPRKDVVTGLIKTNIPGRISFKVASRMDSRIILDESGAERLLARGDMLFLSPGFPKSIRCHGPWVTENEIISVMDYWSSQGDPEYNEKAMEMTSRTSSSGMESEVPGFDEQTEEFDDRYDEIIAWVAGLREVSASLIQRKFRIGYPRAARLIETMEKEGAVGPANGSKPRQVTMGRRS